MGGYGVNVYVVGTKILEKLGCYKGLNPMTAKVCVSSLLMVSWHTMTRVID